MPTTRFTALLLETSLTIIPSNTSKARSNKQERHCRLILTQWAHHGLLLPADSARTCSLSTEPRGWEAQYWIMKQWEDYIEYRNTMSLSPLVSQTILLKEKKDWLHLERRKENLRLKPWKKSKKVTESRRIRITNEGLCLKVQFQDTTHQSRSKLAM